MNYNNSVVRKLVKQALKEDKGRRDITTELVIPKNKSVKAVILAKQGCVVCGLKVAELVFKTKDKKLQFKTLVKDGQSVKKGKILAQVQGKARPILTAERVALNFLGLLSGIATKTRLYVNVVKPYKAKIMDTRKTIPGLRELEKYAVRVGGGYNHRMRLDEIVIIKDNHIEIINPKQIPNPKSSRQKSRDPDIASGQIPNLQSLIKKIREKIPKIKIEIEVKNLKEFRNILKLNPDIIMLDNMNLNAIKKAVKIRNRLSTKLEASGGINFKNIKGIAASGVDMISIGQLTHSVKSIDISLEIL